VQAGVRVWLGAAISQARSVSRLELAGDRDYRFVPPDLVLAGAGELEAPASEVAVFTEGAEDVLRGLDDETAQKGVTAFVIRS
jgi:hypothetical protein